MVGMDEEGTYGTLNVAADGGYTYTLLRSARSLTGDESPLPTDVFSYLLAEKMGTGARTDTGLLTITITGVNDAPVPSAIAPLAVTVGKPFTSAAFAEFMDDDGDTATYTAPMATHAPAGGSAGSPIARPAWLEFDATARVFSGTAPLDGADGVWTVPVIGTDGGDGSVSATANFVLTVNITPTPSFSIAATSTASTADPVEFTVTRTNTEVDRAVSVNIDITNADGYVTAPARETLAFGKGVNSLAISLPRASPNTKYDSDGDTITATLATSADYIIGTASASLAVVDIHPAFDLGQTPVVAQTTSGGQAGGDITFTVNRIGSNTGALQLPVTVSATETSRVDAGDLGQVMVDFAEDEMSDTITVGLRGDARTGLVVTATMDAADASSPAWIVGANSTASASVNAADNNVPVVANPIGVQMVNEDATWTFPVPANTFADDDMDTLAWSAVLVVSGNDMSLDGVSWLSFDADSASSTHRTFTGMPTNAEVGDHTLKVSVSDGHGGTADHSFTLRVNSLDLINRPPTLTVPTAREGVAAYDFLQRNEQFVTEEMTHWRTGTRWFGMGLPAQWFPEGTSATDRRVKYIELGLSGEVALALGTRVLNSSGAGPGFLMPGSIRMVILYETAVGQGTLAIQGVGTGTAPDATEPYRWTPTNSAEVTAAVRLLGVGNAFKRARVLRVEFNDTGSGETQAPTRSVFDLTSEISLGAQSYGGPSDARRWRSESWIGPNIPDAWLASQPTTTDFSIQGKLSELQRVLLRASGEVELRFGYAGTQSSPLIFSDPGSIRLVFTYRTPDGVGTLAIKGLNTTGNQSPFRWMPANAAEVAAVANLMSSGLSEDNRILSVNFNNAGRGETRAPAPVVQTAQDTDVTEAGGLANADGGDPKASGSFSVMDDMPGATIQGRMGTAGAWVPGSDTASSGPNGARGALISGTYGDLYLKADASWTYQLADERAATEALAAGASETDAFNFRASDGTDFSMVLPLDIKVTGANDAPTKGTDIPNPAESIQLPTGGTAFSHSFSADDAFNDVDDASLTYSITDRGGASWVSDTLGTSGDTLTVTGDPSAAVAGAYTITITATDGSGGTVTNSFVITVLTVNTASTPNFSIAATSTASTADPVEFTVTRTNTEADRAVSVSIDITNADGYVTASARETLAFGKGVNSLAISLPRASPNTKYDSDGDTITATLATSADYTIGTASASLAVIDIHPAFDLGQTPVVAQTTSGGQAGGDITFTVNRIGSNTGALQLPVTVSATETGRVDAGDLGQVMVDFAEDEMSDTITVGLRGDARTGLMVTATMDAADASSPAWIVGANSTASASVDAADNNRPRVANPIGVQTVDEDDTWSFPVPENTFADDDMDTLDWSAVLVVGGVDTDLDGVSWLSFDADSASPTHRTFTGMPTNAEVGDHTLKVSVSDGHGGTQSHSFTLRVNSLDLINRPPTLTVPTAREGVAAFDFLQRNEQFVTEEMTHWRTGAGWFGMRLPAQWFPEGTSVTDRWIKYIELGLSGEVALALGTRVLSSSGAGQGFLKPGSIRMVILYETAVGQGTLAIQGVGTGTAPDATEPYRWTPTNSAEVTAAVRLLRTGNAFGGARVLRVEFNDTGSGETQLPTRSVFDITSEISRGAQSYGGPSNARRWRTESWTGPNIPDAWLASQPTTTDFGIRGKLSELQRVLLRASGEVELRFGYAGTQSSTLIFRDPGSIRLVFTYRTPDGVGTLAIKGLNTTGNQSPFRWMPANAAEVAAVANLMSSGLSEDNRILSVNFNNAGRGETRAPAPVVQPAQDTDVTEAGGLANADGGDPEASGSFSIMDDMPGATIQGRMGTAGAWVPGSDTASSGPNGARGALISGTYGDLYLKADASWTYQLADERAATEALAAGASETDAFNFRASDGTDFSMVLPLDIKVTGANDAPTKGTDIPNPAESIQLPTGGTVFSHSFSADDAFNDVDDASLTYSITDRGGASWVSDTLGTSGDTLTVTGDPSAAAAGAYTITITATDGSGGTVTNSFVITVVAPNNAPVAEPDTDTITAMANDEAVLTVTAANGLLMNDTGIMDTDTDDAGFVMLYVAGNKTLDPDDMATLTGSSMVGMDEEGTYGTLNVAADGGYTYTLLRSARSLTGDESPLPTDVFSYLLAEKMGTGARTDTGLLTITITGVNDAPVPSAIAPLAVTAGKPSSSTAFDEFTDDDGDTATYTAPMATHAPAGGSAGSPVARPSWLEFDATTRVFSVTAPLEGADGVWTVPVIGTDGGDGTVSATANFVLTVNAAPNFSIAVKSTAATADPVEFTVTRTNTGSSGAVSVSIGITNAGGYVTAEATETLDFGTGVNSLDISLPRAGPDTKHGAGDTITATLVAGTDYTIGTASSASFAVIDIHPAFGLGQTPVVAQTTTGGVAGGDITFTVNRIGSNPGALTLPVTVTATETSRVDAGDLGQVMVDFAEDEMSDTFTVGLRGDARTGLVVTATMDAAGSNPTWIVGAGGTASASVNAADNNVPVVANTIGVQMVNEDATWTFPVPANTFTDADSSDTLAWSAALVVGGSDT